MSGPDMEEALRSAAAWLDRWAVHVGACAGGDRCTCGLTAIRSEVASAIPVETDPDQPPPASGLRPSNAGVAGKEAFQARVRPWMHACFGEVIPYDRTERGDRLLEEVFELLQSGGYDPARVLELRDYTWARPPGEPRQEVGGVMVTLAAYCLAHDLDMHEAGETELARIWTKVEAIRAKQAAKPRGIALPVDPATLSREAPPDSPSEASAATSVEDEPKGLHP